MIYLSLRVSKVETNQDRHQDYSICWDKLLKPVEIFSTVKKNFFLSPSRFLKSRLFSWDFVLSRFLLRLSRFVGTNQDLSRNLDIMETFWVWKWQKSFNKLRNMDEKYAKIHLLLDRDFWVWTLMSRQNQEILISIKISWLSRWTFWKCQDFLHCLDELFDNVEIESLHRDMIKTNQETPGLDIFLFIQNVHYYAANVFFLQFYKFYLMFVLLRIQLSLFQFELCVQF
jgi:hypothetical protein